MPSESLTKFNYTVDSLAHLNATEFLIFKKTGFLNISHGIFGNLLPEYVLHGGGGRGDPHPQTIPNNRNFIVVSICSIRTIKREKYKYLPCFHFYFFPNLILLSTVGGRGINRFLYFPALFWNNLNLGSQSAAQEGRLGWGRQGSHPDQCKVGHWVPASYLQTHSALNDGQRILKPLSGETRPQTLYLKYIFY